MEEGLFSFQSKKDFRTCVISYMFHLIEINNLSSHVEKGSDKYILFVLLNYYRKKLCILK